MAELYRFELKKMFAAEGALDHRGNFAVVPVSVGGGSLPADHGQRLRGEEIIRLHREGGAALAG